MKAMREREIKELLTPRERPEPPAGLAERIKREIPDRITLAPDAGGTEPHTVPMPRSRVWLMAASVALALGGGFFALRVWQQMTPPGPAPVRTADATAGERAAAEGSIAEVSETSKTAPADAPEKDVGAPREVARTLEDAAPARERGRLAEPDAEPAADDAESTRLAAKAGAPEARGNEAPARGDRDSKLQQLEEELDEVVAKQVAGSEIMPEAEPISVSSGYPVVDPVEPPPPPARQSRTATPEDSKQVRQKDADVPYRGGSPRIGPAPEPVVAPSPPRAEVPKPAEGLKSLGYVAPTRENLRIESPSEGNARIAEMRAEARKLEEELKKVDEAVVRRESHLESLPVQRQPLDAVNVAPGAPPSTGGTAEPNDAPYGDMFFDSAGVNPFVDTEDDALSTFGLDVDTGSYTVGRRYLRDGHLPPPESVRVEEYLNYFDYGDPPPEKGDFAIHAEGAPSLYGEGERYYLLRFNLKGREIAREDRRPAMLTFVVDVSGSMARENRLGLVKQALTLLLEQLRSGDRVALVVYGSHGRVVLEPTGDGNAIRRAIEALRPEGSTNAEEGLTLAYELAARHRQRGTINRVILCSDGVANVGRTSAESILERIRREADQGVELTTVGFGMGNYNDELMERLADTGNGRYAYVDQLGEAQRIFVENLTGTLQTIAAEARVQVEFNPEVVSRYRLLGYENRDIADHRFRDDTVDAGEIGAGHTVTALYEIKLHRELTARHEIGTLRLRYGSIDRGEMVEVARTVTGADFARRWDDASPALELTSLVAEFAEILKLSYWARKGDLDDVFRRAQKVSAEFAGDREVADLVSLVGRAAELWER